MVQRLQPFPTCGISSRKEMNEMLAGELLRGLQGVNETKPLAKALRRHGIVPIPALNSAYLGRSY